MGIIAVDASLVSATSTSETTVFSATVPANTIQSDKWVVVKMLGRFSGGAAIATLRIKFGGTTYYQDNQSTAGAGAGLEEPNWFTIVLAGNNATNAQTLGGALMTGTAGGATTGLGDFDTDEIGAATPFLNDGVATDQTSNQTFAVTVQWDSIVGSPSFDKYYGVIYDMTDVAAAVLPQKLSITQWAVARAATW